MQGDQYIVWKSVPRPGKKPDKIPFDPVGGRNINAHDPANWMSRADAEALATLYGHGVAFVLTRDDPYHCIDLDAAATPDGQWSSFALNVLARFPGAMVERSFSGDGLHVWLQADVSPDHRTRDDSVAGLEIYSHSRSIALGSGAIGNPDIVYTAAFEALVSEFLPGERVTPANWTTAPCEAWAGPDDDDELLRRMLSATSGLSMMMGRASLVDLWDGDAEAIARSYPSVTPGEPYDRSSADAALCTHLAWWTGKNCERIDRLFRRSKLMRDKWDRDDYRHHTVGGGVALVSSVYHDPGADVTALTVTDATLRDASRVILDAPQQMEYFKGCVWVRDQNAIMVPDGALLNMGQFNAAYGGYDPILDFNGKYAKTPWDAFTNSRCVAFPKVMSTCFRPRETPGSVLTEEGETRVNIYRPVDITAVEGDAAPFLGLVSKLFPDPHDRSIIMAYVAACVQFPGIKFQWAPLIQGTEGNGKTFIATCISYAIGQRYCHTPNAQDISNKFNGWVTGKLFAIVEEVYTRDRFECTEALKPLITNNRIEIHRKGANQITGDNYVNFFLTSNHRDAIAKTRDDRRYGVFYTPQQTYADLLRDGMGGSYFPDLYRWLNTGGAAIVTWYLQHYQIPDELNPATSCHRAPETTSTSAAIEESLGNVEQEIIEAVRQSREGFRGGYVSSVALVNLLDERRYKIAPKRRNAIMKTIGYITHPGLPKGRTTRSPGLKDEGSRITLYVHSEDPARMITGGDAIIDDYVGKQGWNLKTVLTPVGGAA